jgi:hypothetical protein
VIVGAGEGSGGDDVAIGMAPQVITSLASIAIPDWWSAMTTAEQFASIGGLAGLLSIVVTVFIAWDSRKTAKKQLDLAAEANATTRMSVEQQVALDERARSASVRVVQAVFHGRTHPNFREDVRLKDLISDNGVEGIVTLALLNEGMATAYEVAIKPVFDMEAAIDGSRSITFHGENDQFAFMPFKQFPSIPSDYQEQFRVAIRNIHRDGELKNKAILKFNVTYRDHFGHHNKTFEVNLYGLHVLPNVEGLIVEDEYSATARSEEILRNIERKIDIDRKLSS